MNYLIGLITFPKKPQKNKLFYDELIMMKKHFLIALASLTIGIAPLSTHANTFVVSQKSLEFDEYPYESCGETCPEIDYSFIDTGYNWLDAIINKDVVLGLSGYIEEGSSEDKEWQAFKNIKNPKQSVAVVNTTAEAIAGSIFNAFNVTGIKNPIIQAITRFPIIARNTINPI